MDIPKAIIFHEVTMLSYSRPRDLLLHEKRAMPYKRVERECPTNRANPVLVVTEIFP